MTSTNESAVVVVTRWRRYGHDRAYVKRGGEDLGYRDLLTGLVHPTAAEHESIVAEATATFEANRTPQYEARHALPETPQPPRPSTVKPVAATQLLPDRDLAENQPGAGLRARANTMRADSPVQSLVTRMLGIKTEERQWRLGAEGEEEVGRRLAKLGPEWRVLHSVPVGNRGSDIDHLVIGPPGVFVINTKHYPDAKVVVNGDSFRVNGRANHTIENSRHEAKRAAGALTARLQFDVDVRGIVAVMGVIDGFTVTSQPTDGRVWVVTRRALRGYLQGLPARLDKSTIERVYGIARHLATWQSEHVAWSESLSHPEFE